MFTFLKKIFGKKDNLDDFILMNNDILYNDFIIKENVQNDKFTKSNNVSPNLSNQNFMPHENLSLNKDLESPSHNKETNYESIRKENQTKNDSHRFADINMVNIHESLKDVVVDELETTIVVPRKTNIDKSYVKNNNETPQNNSAYINNKMPQGNDFFINNESDTKSKYSNDSWTGNENISTQQNKNAFGLNENRSYNSNNDLMHNDNNDNVKRNNSFKYEEDYKYNNKIDNKIPKQNDVYGYDDQSSKAKNYWDNGEKNFSKQNNLYGYQENKPVNFNSEWQNNVKGNTKADNEWLYDDSTIPQMNYSNDALEDKASPINIVPINLEAKEKYDTESNYRVNSELENTQNLSILQFYKDLNHFKVLSEEEKIFLAIEKAKSTLHYFVKVISNPTNIHANFSIKAKIKDNFNEENLWINNVRYNNFVFEGILGNYPKSIKNVKYGDNLKISIDDVIDWMFVENKRLIGGYSIRVARSMMDEQDRQKFDKSLFFFIDEGEDYFREDLSTPEGSITTYEEAYRRQDLNVILKCKNFKEEAKIYMLKKFGSFFYDEKSLIDLQESLKLSFIKKIEIEGFKKIDWRKRAFTRRDYIDDDLVLVTEWVFKEDGTKSRMRYYVWRNPNYMWKVLCEEK